MVNKDTVEGRSGKVENVRCKEEEVDEEIKMKSRDGPPIKSWEVKVLSRNASDGK